MNTEQRLKQLERQVAELTNFKEKKESQQISFPLDITSINILNKYFLRIVGKYVYGGGVALQPFTVYEGLQDQTRVEFQNSSIEYTADPTTNILTLIYPNDVTYSVDSVINIVTTDTPPGGLSELTNYYISSPTPTGFKLAASPGGAAIDITSKGIGRQFLIIT